MSNEQKTQALYYLLNVFQTTVKTIYNNIIYRSGFCNVVFLLHFILAPLYLKIGIYFKTGRVSSILFLFYFENYVMTYNLK